MKPQPPKPANKQKYIKALESIERKTDELMSPSTAFKEHVEAIWDLKDLSEKDMLALFQYLKHRRQPFFLVTL